MGFSAYVGGRVYQFSMTAGVSGTFTGYAADIPHITPHGSISNEPIPGYTLATTRSVASGGGFIAISFVGNVTPFLSGFRVFIDGVNYPPTADWTYIAQTDQTSWSVSGIGSSFFTNGQTYTIQLRR